MPNKFHFGCCVGSKGSVQKIKSALSNTTKARYQRAIIREENKITYQERMEKYTSRFEDNQQILENNRTRKVLLRSKQEGQSTVSKETTAVII